ncbi:36.4 kDa proline-rich protein [Cryptomeria japonica]|uniref:36.4 kDa proline-rich protein n=1 Tax=Cryptomeria japonica TaxID=3369 RepID=UPI0027DA674B|nr:36.4 kDa proline-rich protein [Cryptomeria japonica]
MLYKSHKIKTMVKVKMRKMEAIFLLVMISIAMSKSSVIACGSPYCRPPVYKPPTVPSPNVPYNPPGGGKCPIDALKLGACVDLLNHLVHIGIGDPVINKCCPLIQGVAELEAALCLCTIIRAKLLNLNILLPLALQLFVQCGLTPPPGFTCPPLT